MFLESEVVRQWTIYHQIHQGSSDRRSTQRGTYITVLSLWTVRTAFPFLLFVLAATFLFFLLFTHIEPPALCRDKRLQSSLYFHFLFDLMPDILIRTRRKILACIGYHRSSVHTHFLNLGGKRDIVLK